MSRCVIVGAGEFVSDEMAISILKSDDYIISADGGYDYLKKIGIVPNIAIGDFDSAKNIPSDTETIILSPEKDVTDTFFASQLAIKKGYKEIIYLGMLGGRLDHTMANIQTLNYLLDNNIRCHIYDEKMYITAIRDSEITLKPQKNKYLSIFSMGEKAEGVFLKNTKYQLENYVLKNNYPIGISNEFIDKDTFIKVKNGSILIMISSK